MRPLLHRSDRPMTPNLPPCERPVSPEHITGHFLPPFPPGTLKVDGMASDLTKPLAHPFFAARAFANFSVQVYAGAMRSLYKRELQAFFEELRGVFQRFPCVNASHMLLGRPAVPPPLPPTPLPPLSISSHRRLGYMDSMWNHAEVVAKISPRMQRSPMIEITLHIVRAIDPTLLVSAQQKLLHHTAFRIASKPRFR